MKSRCIHTDLTLQNKADYNISGAGKMYPGRNQCVTIPGLPVSTEVGTLQPDQHYVFDTLCTVVCLPGITAAAEFSARKRVPGELLQLRGRKSHPSKYVPWMRGIRSQNKIIEAPIVKEILC